ncbi:unnamed protein product [Bursaphelenchus xylophilus]|uniref:(pine wood nematode) hypothetical protein n=1 Tax=Bursaphelenchus xylophilus TaxID=6326 RepID=A0A1I7SX31_BURXY|nr:unnamed protein product [Bursaphelenchus xylophilus]CAG9100138.1 unnamed protein product [Bursaphelenchus xylophilus]
MAEGYERVLLMKSEVFVFRIPPLGASKGHKAADWNLDQPNWVGRLRLLTVDDRLEIRLEDKSTGVLYAKAPIESAPSMDFESVTDSSRYFVIRLKNDNGQTAFVGIGFSDRSDSFDLNVAVQDHFKGIQRDHELAKEDESRPKLDLGFKEGQTININIGGLKKSEKSTPRSSAPSSGDGPVPLLPPPPSSSSRVRRAQN